MDAILGVAMLVVFIPTLVVAPIAWVCIVVYGFKTIANRKPEVDLWRDAPMGNPANIMLDSKLLTDEGLRCRSIMAKSILWFAVPILLSLALGAATGNLG